MSEYPRPSEAALPKPYLPDRVAAMFFAVLLIRHKVVWILDLSRTYGLVPSIETWWPYFLAEVAYLFFELWMLLVLTRNRHWAFVVTTVLTVLALASCVWTKNIPTALAVFPVFVYVVARLCRMVGPRPLRRYETR